jgi:hypothetical protein
MKKTTFYQLIIALLLLSNVVCLYLFFTHHPPKPEGPKRYIIEKLHFNDKQIQAYEKLIMQHRHAIHRSEKKLLQLKSKLYQQLDAPNEFELIHKIGNIQQEIELIHIAHFKAIKKLCNRDQLNYFNELQQNMAALFNRQQHPPRP